MVEKMRNTKPYRALPIELEQRSYWEVWLLIAFIVTILGIMAYAPVNSFPALKVSGNYENPVQDPYGLRADHTINGVGTRVATGL